jgi:hypothetical protein
VRRASIWGATGSGEPTGRTGGALSGVPKASWIAESADSAASCTFLGEFAMSAVASRCYSKPSAAI